MTSPFHWNHTKDFSEFVHKTKSFFLNFESRYVQVYSNLLDKEPSSSTLLILFEETTCVGFSFCDGKGNLHISDIPLGTVASLVKKIIHIGCQYTRVAAPPIVAKHFLTLIQQDFKLDMNQFVFSCSHVQLPPHDDGQLTRATIQDIDTAHSMFEGFFVSCWPETPIPQTLGAMLLKEMEKDNVFFWRDSAEHVVSMAAVVRETTNTASISWVYTPIEYRGKGYGSKVTAYLSQDLLQQGFQECNLFTDASNPISNHVYTKIGYIQIGAQSVYSLANMR